MIKLSIIHPVLNSHEVIRRQLIHYEKQNLPDDVEIIIVDDGSDPPLVNNGLKNLSVYYTHDSRPWTWPIARNLGAKKAKGNLLFFADIDYIIPREAILMGLDLKEDRMNVRREFGVLDKDGNLTQDLDVLKQYGLPEDRIKVKGTNVSAHTNTFIMKKEVFFKMGGYREDRIGRPYPQREDGDFDRAWLKRYEKGEFNRTHDRPTVYMFPNGKFCGDVDYNPFNLFHNTSRKNK